MYFKHFYDLNYIKPYFLSNSQKHKVIFLVKCNFYNAFLPIVKFKMIFNQFVLTNSAILYNINRKKR